MRIMIVLGLLYFMLYSSNVFAQEKFLSDKEQQALTEKLKKTMDSAGFTFKGYEKWRNMIRGLSRATVSQLCDGLMQRSQSITSIDQKVAFQVFIARALYDYAGDTYAALDIYEQLLPVCKREKLRDKEARIYHLMGAMHFRYKKDPQALYYFLKSQNIYKAMGHKPKQVQLLKELAKYHYYVGDPGLAISLYQEYISKRQFVKSNRFVIDAWNTIGLIYRRQGKYAKAIHHFEVALSLARKHQDEPWIGLARGNIGDVYYLENNFKKARPLLLDDLKLSYKHQIWGNVTKVLHTLGDISFKKRQWKEAKMYFDSTITVCQQKGDDEGLLRAYISQAQLHETQGALGEANRFLKLVQQVKDSSFNGQVNRIAAKASIKRIYDLVARETENEKLTEKNRNKTITIQRQYLSLISVLILFVFVLILVVMSQRNLKKKKKLNQELKIQNDLIVEQNENIRQKNLKLSETEEEMKLLIRQLQENENALIASKKQLLNQNDQLTANQEELQQQQQEIELLNVNLKAMLQTKEEDLALNTMHLARKNELIQKVQISIKKLKPSVGVSERKYLQKIIQELASASKLDSWKDFELRFKEVHSKFYENLQSRYPDLTANERRLCIFLKLGMSTKEISSLTLQSVNTINVARTRLKKKLQLDDDSQTLLGLIQNI